MANKDFDSGGNIGYVLAPQGPPYTAQTGGFKWNFTTDVVYVTISSAATPVLSTTAIDIITS